MKITNNGFGKDEQIKFPVSFDLKVIMLTVPDPQNSIAELELLLVQLKIPFKNWRHKPSGKGTYTSFTVRVDIVSQELMTKLYADLKTVPNVKMAL
jgi:putative lipoic acid-binding regulatory protein